MAGWRECQRRKETEDRRRSVMWMIEAAEGSWIQSDCGRRDGEGEEGD